MDKIHSWINTVLIGIVLISMLVGGNNQPVQIQGDPVGSGTRFPNGLSADGTSPSAGQVRGTTLTVTGAATIATTTITKSFDTFMIGGSISTAATNTPRTIYTNDGAPIFCDSSTAGAFWDSTDYSPAHQFSVGTSTSNAAPSASLIATTTVATSTDTVTPTHRDLLFIMNKGDTVVALTADDSDTGASSTNFSAWTAEFQVECWSIGG